MQILVFWRPSGTGKTIITWFWRWCKLAERYADRKPDLADLCLIRLSEFYPRYPVITTDVAGFRIYRRARREAIPLIHPS
ncbi:MAG TPA: hypothetical protein VME43_00695 [Bryobacteraceae bacterium]|nr:hypothetical protein [Bryobacteraceae bacterium]